MQYKITGYIKNHSSYYETKLCEYTSEIVPHIDECIYLPHKGAYQIIQVIYNVSDDGYGEFDNKIMFVDLFLRPKTLY